MEHCRGGHLCVASTRSGQGPFKGVRLWLTSSTALLMSVSPEVEPPPDASEDVVEDESDDEAATEARHTASASSCIARMCLVFLLFVLFFFIKSGFINSFFNTIVAAQQTESTSQSSGINRCRRFVSAPPRRRSVPLRARVHCMSFDLLHASTASISRSPTTLWRSTYQDRESPPSAPPTTPCLCIRLACLRRSYPALPAHPFHGHFCSTQCTPQCHSPARAPHGYIAAISIWFRGSS